MRCGLPAWPRPPVGTPSWSAKHAPAKAGGRPSTSDGGDEAGSRQLPASSIIHRTGMQSYAPIFPKPGSSLSSERRNPEIEGGDMFARLLPAALAAWMIGAAAIAQTTAPPTRIRGTIAAVEGQTLSVATREGSKVDVVLGDPLTVATVKKVDLASIAPNSFVGIATRNGANGEMQAIEVLVFPESMRGAGE